MKSFVIATCVLSLFVPAQEPQPGLPKTAAEVTAPAPGARMHAEYAQSIARFAYVWGWPLVSMLNRSAAITQAPEPGKQGGVLPVAPRGQICMLTDYLQAGQDFLACPTQDVVCGLGFFSLDEEPVVVQVPEFGPRFWSYSFYDARTEQFAELGKAQRTKPGFYLLVGPRWSAENPAGFEAVIRSPTALACAIPRVYKDESPHDQRAVQALLDQVVFYPVKDFDGQLKTKEWAKVPTLPGPQPGGPERRWVVPERFFDQLGAVLDTVAPLPGEEALYGQFRMLLDVATRERAIKKAIVDAAIETERDVIQPFLEWKRNGRAAANGWSRSTNNAHFGHDYFNRTGSARSQMFDSQLSGTKYFYTDDDSQGARLDGKQLYEVTFAAGQEPPVSGFWSLTLYDEQHFFHQNELQRYSLGTKSRGLKRAADGALTLYVGAESPGADKESNWIPAPQGRFSLCLRAYGVQAAVVNGTWKPPVIRSVR